MQIVAPHLMTKTFICNFTNDKWSLWIWKDLFLKREVIVTKKVSVNLAKVNACKWKLFYCKLYKIRNWDFIVPVRLTCNVLKPALWN